MYCSFACSFFSAYIKHNSTAAVIGTLGSVLHKGEVILRTKVKNSESNIGDTKDFSLKMLWLMC